jgi:hypothetical protein
MNCSYPTADLNAIRFFERDHAKGGECHFRRRMAMAGQAVRAVYCRKKAQESQNGVAAAKVARVS